MIRVSTPVRGDITMTPHFDSLLTGRAGRTDSRLTVAVNESTPAVLRQNLIPAGVLSEHARRPIERVRRHVNGRCRRRGTLHDDVLNIGDKHPVTGATDPFHLFRFSRRFPVPRTDRSKDASQIGHVVDMPSVPFSVMLDRGSEPGRQRLR